VERVGWRPLPLAIAYGLAACCPIDAALQLNMRLPPLLFELPAALC
jgi:hypothetical protein